VTASGRIARLDVLGVEVSATDIPIPIAIGEIDRWIQQGRRSYVTLTGVHGVTESVRNEEIRRVHNAAGSGQYATGLAAVAGRI
jgi:N-acetylglucosaminyldiphosphoundecaprenol N-acetyl-beta-D-mannosaminyltransferase